MSTKEKIKELTEILEDISLEEYKSLDEELKELLDVIESNYFLLT